MTDLPLASADKTHCCCDQCTVIFPAKDAINHLWAPWPEVPGVSILFDFCSPECKAFFLLGRCS